ncbi:MAG TPA: HEAT repeat domain-containing protein [candidate division Zixibacteria bacterium]|nr:HEAT repeat domain-containing protein [candidate division Zixibacteria bacterium]
MKLSIWASILIVLATTALAQTPDTDSFPPSLDKAAWAQIDSMLMFAGLTRKDAGFEKKWATDTLFRLEIVGRMLDNPLELPDTLDSWTRFALDNYNSPKAHVPWAFSLIDADIPMRTADRFERRIAQISAKDNSHGEVPEPYRNALMTILAGFDIAGEHIDNMLKGISEESRDSLLFLLPTFWTSSQDTSAKYLSTFLLDLVNSDFDTSYEVSLDSLYETIYEIDLEELGLAAYAVMLGVEKAVEIMRTATSDDAPTEMIEIETRWGKAIIGTEGSDIFGDAQIILDPGGDDFYIGEHAAGRIGEKPFGVVIDMDGNDLYDGRSSIFNQASGVFGVGVLVDLDGDDTYRATHYAQGAGLFGSGILIDMSGDDIYSGATFVQGAGNFGMGMLIDIEGEDAYRAHCYAQAFAGPKGIGLLRDYSGSDQYFAGGKYNHAPLAPFDYQSFAQGFAIGWRPDVSGGVGFLFDREGNDTYSSGIYAQGVSYWYALGALVDNGGNDVFTSVWYPQGSGIHLSAGAVVNRGGNDIYVSPQGPGQGSAHDYSVGFFSDFRGDDIYVIDGGNAASLTNSFALFVDRNGNDLYAKRRLTSANWGEARGARGTGSIALFLDMEGDDHYSDETLAGNNRRWFSGDIGFGMDIAGEKFPDPVRELAEEIAEEEDEDSVRTIEKIFADASMWSVGSAKDKADKAFEELVDSAESAVKYICETQLDTKSSLRTRTIERFSKRVPELMKPCLYDALHDNKNIRRRGSAIYFLGEIGDEEAVDSLLPFLKIERTRLGTISALGKIKSKGPVPEIMKWAKDKKQSVRYMTAKALADIEDARAIPAHIEALGDEYMTVRVAAQNGLVAMREESFEAVLGKLPTAKKPAIFHLLRVVAISCARFEADEELDEHERQTRLAMARNAVFPLLDSPDATVRGHAVRCLGSVGGGEMKSELRRRYEMETDSFVRSMFEAALGR